MALFSIFDIFKRKKKLEYIKKEPEIREEKKIPVEKKRMFDFFEKNGKTDILFNEKIVLENSKEAPFLSLYLVEEKIEERKEQIKKGLFKKEEHVSYRNSEMIIKTIPLTESIVERCDETVTLLLHNRGYHIRASLFCKENKLIYDIENSHERSYVVINVPRGTKRELNCVVGNTTIEGQSSFSCFGVDNKAFDYKITQPIFHDGEGVLYRIKSVGYWSVRLSAENIKLKAAGKRVQLVENRFSDTASLYRDIDGDKKTIKKSLFSSEIAKKCFYSTFDTYRKDYEENREKSIAVLLYSGEGKEKIREARAFFKKKGVLVYCEIIPYVKEGGEADLKELLIPLFDESSSHAPVLEKNSDRYLCEHINGEIFFAVDITAEETQRRIKNQARFILDEGINGIVSSHGAIDAKRLPSFSPFVAKSFAWAEIWQGLFVEPVKEYPSVKYYIKEM